MNRIFNNPDLMVEDALRGFLLAHAGLVRPTANPRVLVAARAPVAGKVGIVTGGGSGHEPAFLGYVGPNMIDAVAIGEIFSSPSAQNFCDAFLAADAGAGVACLYGNYAGDNMNVKMAVRMALQQGTIVKTVVANDDVPSASPHEREKRRGVAGEILMWKAGAARAAQGGTLDEVIAVAQKAIDTTRSIGIGLSACTIPAAGKPNFTIAPGRMELGIGHHGEPGVAVVDMARAQDMARMMLDAILPDLPFADGDRVAALVSGLGATPIMELYILLGDVERGLSARGIAMSHVLAGNFFTSLDMMGATLSLMRLDDELEPLIAYPARCAAFSQGAA